MPITVLRIFTKYPQPGSVKTRLIPTLGGEGAAILHRRMVTHTLVTVQRFNREGRHLLWVCFDGATQAEMERWLGAGLHFSPQKQGDLGYRMDAAFREDFAIGARRSVIIGTDCPGLNSSILHQAFAALGHADVVLGPAHDGGYYLVGLRKMIPDLFRGIEWGTSRVLSETLAIADRLGLAVHQLPILHDVDRPEDLPAWEACPKLCLNPQRSPLVSVVIPALNESCSIGRVLATIESRRPIEAIVVDGGSHDATMEVASEYGARVIVAPRGRAHQMNAGARIARGRILLFLHGDTQLPPRFDDLVHNALRPKGTIAGAFSLRIAGEQYDRALRIIARIATWRSRFLQLPYGDQGLFLKADTFHRLRGFPETPILEDYLLVKRLKRLGKIRTLRAAISTSPRRWALKGPAWITLQNQLILLGYHLGVSPSALARWSGRSTTGEE